MAIATTTTPPRYSGQRTGFSGSSSGTARIGGCGRVIGGGIPAGDGAEGRASCGPTVGDGGGGGAKPPPIGATPAPLATGLGGGESFFFSPEPPPIGCRPPIGIRPSGTSLINTIYLLHLSA